MIVVDASAVLTLLLQDAPELERRLLGEGELICAPHLIDLEILQVLRRLCARGDLTLERAETALDIWSGLEVDRWPHDLLAQRMWALRAAVTAYDAAYVALAELLGVVLVTSDQKIALAPGHTARVEVIRA